MDANRLVSLRLDGPQVAETFTDLAKTTLTTSATSSKTAWSALVADLRDDAVDSKVTIDEGAGCRSFFGGGVQFRFPPRRFRPYGYAEGGYMVFDAGDEPHATVIVDTQFKTPSGLAPIHQIDKVNIHFEVKNTFAARFGGGVEFAGPGKLQFFAEASVYTWQNDVRTILDATPSNVIGTPQGGATISANPTIQYSTVSQFQNTLSSTTTNFPTFKNNGTRFDFRPSIGVQFGL